MARLAKQEVEPRGERRLNPLGQMPPFPGERRSHSAHFFENRAVTPRLENMVVNPRPLQESETTYAPLQSLLPVGLLGERIIYEAKASFGNVEKHRITFDDSRIAW